MKYFTRAVFQTLLLLCLGAQSQVNAAVVQGLYQTDVIVPDQSASARQAAFRKAFQRVIIKVAGGKSVIDHAVIQKTLGRAIRFVREYRYSEKLVPAVKPDLPPVTEVHLSVSFAGKSIEALLRDNELPVWGEERPATLLWLAIEQQGRRKILASDVDDPMGKLVHGAATRRGIPVLLPLLDLEDYAHVQFSDIRAGFADNILQASQRYAADAVAFGYLQQRARGVWQGDLTLIFANQTLHWTMSGNNPEVVLAQGINHMSDALATQFAFVSGQFQDEALLFEVTGVRNVKDYARTLKYLKKLSTVESVDVLNVTPDKVDYRLRLRGGQEDLQRVIGLGNSLERVALPSLDLNDPDALVKLQYQLRP
ncbi:MAG: DUF2066 domain-containing protein [Gammaproteobacteria bacterium]|nr:DUF2066 domain-containing protein [Gammaproteobacteria bacterium]